MADDAPKIQTFHREHTVYEARWRLFSDTYYGEGGFADGSYLVPHPVELDNGQESEAFKKRKEVTKYENDAAWIVDSLHSHLFKRPVARSTKDAELAAWLEDVDGNGTSLGDFLRQAQRQARIFGHVLVFMDRPSSKELAAKAAAVGTVTKADERAAGVAPYVYARSPLQVIDWARDRTGAFEWVKVLETHTVYGTLPPGQTDPLLEAGTKTFTRLWTRTATELWDTSDPEKPVLVDARDHNLGVVPGVILYAQHGKDGELSGKSDLWDIAPIAVKKFNLESEKRELQRNNSFNMLTIPRMEGEEVGEPDPETGERRISVGSGRVLLFNGASSHAPAFIGADASHVESYARDIAAATDQIMRLANMKQKGGVSQSGVAWAFDWEQTNNVLARQAGLLKEADIKLIDLWHVWQAGAADLVRWDAVDYRPEYPETFSYSDDAEEIAKAREAQEVDWGSAIFERELAKTRVRRLLPNLPKETVAEIDAEIDAWAPGEEPEGSSYDPTRVALLEEARARAAGGGA
jgi:hypothetical protein